MAKKKIKQHKHPDGIINSYNKKLNQVYTKVLENEIEEKIIKHIDYFVIDGVMDELMLKKYMDDLRNSMLFCNSAVRKVAKESFSKASVYNFKVLKNQLKQADI